MEVGMKRTQADKAAHCVKAIAHPLRLSILALLVDGEKSVQDLTKALGTTQSNISQHLSHMKMRGLLSARRDGNRTFYSVMDPRVSKLIDLMKDLFCRP
jgi:DNA-binding transcriptional ArsR family regulator